MENHSPEYAQEFYSGLTEAERRKLWSKADYFIHQHYGPYLDILGIDAEEIYYDALGDVFSGVRPWPKVNKHGKEIAFATIVFQAIRSKISHLAEKKKRELSIEGIADGAESECPCPNGLSVKVDYEKSIYATECCNRLRARVRHIPILSKLLELMIETEGEMKPKEIAQLWGENVEEIRKALSRLRRMARAIGAEF